MADLGGGFKVSTETPFEIDFDLLGLNTLIEQSDQNALVTEDRSFIRNNCNV